jgi:hypothetical protein
VRIRWYGCRVVGSGKSKPNAPTKRIVKDGGPLYDFKTKTKQNNGVNK